MSRVLFVTAGLGRGGAEVFLVRLACRLASRGHVCAVASLGSHGPLAGDLAASGIAVSELGRGVASPSWRLARFSFANHAHFLRRPHLRHFQRPYATKWWNFTRSCFARAAFAKWE